MKPSGSYYTQLAGILMLSACIASACAAAPPQGAAGKSAPPKVGPPASKPAVPPAQKPTIEDLLRQGAQLQQQNKPEEAAATFRQATQLYPQDIRGFDMLALADLDAKKYEEAEQAAKTATLMDENGPREFDILAEVLSGENKFGPARAAMDRVIELQPNAAAPRLELGQICMKAKDYRAAQRAYLDALGFEPDNPEIHTALGDAYEQQNLHAQAVAEYDAALAAIPPGVTGPAAAVRNQIVLSRAVSLSGMDRYSEAESQVRALIARSPKDAQLHSALAEILDNAGDHQQAIAEYQAELASSPNDAIGWGNLGWAQYNAGDYSAAEASSHKALSLDNTLSYVKFNLGLIYAVQGNWRAAQKQYQEASIGAAPSDIEAAMGDVRNALQRQPTNDALQHSLALLTEADQNALGFIVPKATADRKS